MFLFKQLLEIASGFLKTFSRKSAEEIDKRWSVFKLGLSSLDQIHHGLTEWCLLDIICVLIIPMYLYILWNVSPCHKSSVDLIFREILSSQRKKKVWQRNWKIMNAWVTLNLEQKRVVSSKQSWAISFTRSRL